MSWLERLIAMTCWLALCLTATPAAGQEWARSVTDYGAIADGSTDCTEAFQRAIDECHAAGGGVVHVPPGHWRIATHLEVQASVTLEGVWRAPPTVDAYHDPADPAGGPLLRGSVLLPRRGPVTRTATRSSTWASTRRCGG